MMGQQAGNQERFFYSFGRHIDEERAKWSER
jgi:hypothetical protein